MWWLTLLKFAVVAFLTIVVIVIFAYLLGQQYITSQLNSKIEGQARSRPDITVEKMNTSDTSIDITGSDSKETEEDEIDMGYMSE